MTPEELKAIILEEINNFFEITDPDERFNFIEEHKRKMLIYHVLMSFTDINLEQIKKELLEQQDNDWIKRIDEDLE